jgi:hypothetical protein
MATGQTVNLQTDQCPLDDGEFAGVVDPRGAGSQPRVEAASGPHASGPVVVGGPGQSRHRARPRCRTRRSGTPCRVSADARHNHPMNDVSSVRGSTRLCQRELDRVCQLLGAVPTMHPSNSVRLGLTARAVPLSSRRRCDRAW